MKWWENLCKDGPSDPWGASHGMLWHVVRAAGVGRIHGRGDKEAAVMDQAFLDTRDVAATATNHQVLENHLGRLQLQWR